VCTILFLLPRSVATPNLFLGCYESPRIYVFDVHVIVIDDVDSV